MTQPTSGNFSLFLTIEFTLYIMTQPVCTAEICVYDSSNKIMQLLIQKIAARNSVVHLTDNTGLPLYKDKSFNTAYCEKHVKNTKHMQHTEKMKKGKTWLKSIC